MFNGSGASLFGTRRPTFRSVQSAEKPGRYLHIRLRPLSATAKSVLVSGSWLLSEAGLKGLSWDASENDTIFETALGATLSETLMASTKEQGSILVGRKSSR